MPGSGCRTGSLTIICQDGPGLGACAAAVERFFDSFVVDRAGSASRGERDPMGTG